MVQMMLGARVYAANQRVINAIDETTGRLINEVAMPV
jgi:flagellar basal body rod protein FlgG